MDDVRLAQFAEEQRPVAKLGDGGPKVFDAKEPVEGRLRDRINRDNPGINSRILPPGVHQPLRLHRMPANNAERGDDNGNSEAGSWQGTLHMAEVSRR